MQTRVEPHIFQEGFQLVLEALSIEEEFHLVPVAFPDLYTNF